MSQVTVIPEAVPKALEELPRPRNEHWPVYLAIGGGVVALFGAVVVIYFIGGDSPSIFFTMLTSLITLIPSVLAVIKAQQVSSKVDQGNAKTQEVGMQTIALRIEMDGRFSQMREDIRVGSLAEGKEIGATAQREQAAADTLALAEAKAKLDRQEVELAMLRAAIPAANIVAPETMVPVEPLPVRVVAAVPVPVKIKADDPPSSP